MKENKIFSLFYTEDLNLFLFKNKEKFFFGNVRQEKSGSTFFVAFHLTIFCSI